VGERAFPFRILVIDGAGVRGLVPALVLAELERRAGAPLGGLFDLVVGTSSGGILALGLAMDGASGGPRFGPLDLVSLYEKDGARVFLPWVAPEGEGEPDGPGGWVHALFHPRYQSAGIEEVLQERFGAQTCLSAAAGPEVAVTSCALDDRAVQVFRSWEARTHTSSDFPAWQVARATTAAPVYFPVAQATSRDGRRTVRCVDRGVCVDSPVVLALAEAKALLAQRGAGDRPIFLLSVGPGSRPEASLPYDRIKNGGLLAWLEHGLMDVILDAANDSANQEVGALLADGSYHRLQPPLSGPGYGASPAIDDCSAENLGQLRAVVEHFIETEGDALAALAARLVDAPPA
jgi:uncharacterized protein